MPSSKRYRGKERKAISQAKANLEAVAEGKAIHISDTDLSKRLDVLGENPKSKIQASEKSSTSKDLDALADSLESNLNVSGREPRKGFALFAGSTSCKHGDKSNPDTPDGFKHVTYGAMNYFRDLYMSHTGGNSQSVGTTAITKAAEKFPAIFSDRNCRSMMKSGLVAYATDELLFANASNIDYNWIVSKWCVEAIALLEGFDAFIECDDPNIFMASKIQLKIEKELRDATGDGERRGVIRYIKKRISCNCLDEMYNIHVHKESKMGFCPVCHQIFDYKKVMKRCTGCNLSHYCSLDCQLKDWPAHKSFCKSKARERKRQQRQQRHK